MSLRLGSVVLVLLAGALLPAETPRFVQHPDVRGDQVVFTWDGDLWKTSLGGGPAIRLTSHPGTESSARISPDGRWIAFSGQYDSGTNVYLIPTAGGAPRRLTWRGNATVQGWTPDGKKILFRAGLETESDPITRMYAVDLEGHEPERLPLHKAFQGSYSPDGTYLAFNPKGSEEYYFKRYKGGQHAELWLADLKAGTYRKLDVYRGKNAYPMWSGDRLVFASDRGPGGITNLYRVGVDGRDPRALTAYRDFDVHWPSTDGKTVVFAQAGYLTALDLGTQRTWRVAVDVTGDDWKRRPRTVSAEKWLQTQTLGMNGRTLALEARGDVFLLDTDGKSRARNLTATSGARERLPVLSPDGTRVAYVSDEGGDYDLYVRPAAGGAALRIPTGVKGLFSRLLWSPDGKKLLFGDQSFALYVVDVEGRKVNKVASSSILQNDQFTWEQADYVWAPDSTWIAYSFQEENRLGRIWLQNTATGQRLALTNGFHASLNPCFDADGSRLYFLSHSNFHVVMDPTQDNYIQDQPVQVMAVDLKAKDEPGPFRIDLEGLTDRTRVLPIKAGNLFHLQAGKGVVAFHSLAAWDEPAHEEVFAPKGRDKWTLRLFEVAKGQEVTLADTVSGTSFSPDGGSLLLRKGGALHVGPVAQVLGSKALPAKVDLGTLTLTVDPLQEWNQVWADTWRLYRDFFYDKDMHGNDWKAIGEKYRAWIPQCPSRADLNWMLSQMVGEICVGHTYVGGGDFGPAQGGAPTALRTGLLGADFGVDKGFYTFQKVFGPTPYARGLKAPLANPAPLVKEGEYLLAINGVEIKAPDAIHARLQVASGQKVKLTVHGKPTLEGARTLEVEPVSWDGDLRYARWIADNIATVEKHSEGQLGYMHITAMGEQNLGQFDQYWKAFKYRKGLVVDVRANHGGWTEYFMVDKLERKQVGFNVLRDMLPFRYPNTASDGRYVFLSNEQNGSDGEAFMAHVKARGLGTIVGVPSWGGLVGIINEQGTIDGGSVNQPNNGFYGKEGAWWIENEGALPDVPVDNGPDLKDGDRQLRTAVEVLLKQLKEQPTPTFPVRPAYPKR